LTFSATSLAIVVPLCLSASLTQLAELSLLDVLSLLPAGMA
jgi:hypothetical protein